MHLKHEFFPNLHFRLCKKSQNDGLYWPKVGYKSFYFANYTETVKKKMLYTFQYYIR